MLIRKTFPEEYRRVNELFAICFEMPYQNCPIDPANDQNTHWAAFHASGNMMSTFTISDYSIGFDGHKCLMGGIGGVATLPEYRRQGGIRGCFEAALPDMYAQGYDFSFLYPFSTAYYRQFGYECCVQKMKWVINLGLLKVPNITGTVHLAEKNRPMTQAIQAVDQILEQRFNMMVQHQDSHYKWTAEADPAVKQEFTYVWFDAENIPRAYTTFRVANEADGRNLVCSRFFFTNQDGFRGLLGLFKSLAADHTYLKFDTPLLPSLQYLMPEWSLGAVSWTLQASAGMVRVINAKRILEKARYRGNGHITLEIHDPEIQENSGRYTITFANGTAESVERSQAPADAVMDISTFSALICGVCDWDDAKLTFRGLEIHKEEYFSQVFYRKPLMICDYF